MLLKPYKIAIRLVVLSIDMWYYWDLVLSFTNRAKGDVWHACLLLVAG
jgi:hypothetical protein